LADPQGNIHHDWQPRLLDYQASNQAARAEASGPLWVKLRKTQCEKMFSARPPKADMPAETHGNGLHSKSNIPRIHPAPVFLLDYPDGYDLREALPEDP
jgi:hypothetical protein